MSIFEGTTLLNVEKAKQSITQQIIGGTTISSGTVAQPVGGSVSTGGSTNIKMVPATHYQEIQQHFSLVQRQMFPETTTPIPSPYPAAPAPYVSTPVSSVTPSPGFMGLYAPGFVPIAQRAEYISGGVIPSWLSEQIGGISVPFAIEQAGGAELYRQLSFEKYFLLPSYPSIERSLIKTLESSYWYISTQPVYGGKTFSQIQLEQPALYLMQKPSGRWSPVFDVVRWRSEYEKGIGLGATIVERVSEIPLFMFDIDMYFSQNKSEYLATKFYESHLSMKSGDLWRVGATWAGVQVPAYESFIVPAAGGFVFGKIFTGMKIAGGLAKVGLGTRLAVGVGSILAVESIGFSGYQIASEFYSGDVVKGLSSFTKLGLQLGVGALTFGAASEIVKTSFETRHPDIILGVKGVPVYGEKYVTYTLEKISGPGMPGMGDVVPYRYGAYKISQLFKPGKQVVYSETPLGAYGDISQLYYTGVLRDLSVGYQMGTTEPVSTMFGLRGWGTKTVWGLDRYSVINIPNLVASKAVVSLRTSEFVGLKSWLSFKEEFGWAEMAASPVIPGLDYFVPIAEVGVLSKKFTIPVFPFVPRSIPFTVTPVFIVPGVKQLGVVVPKVKPMVKPFVVVEPVFEIGEKTFVTPYQFFGITQKPVKVTPVFPITVSPSMQIPKFAFDVVSKTYVSSKIMVTPRLDVPVVSVPKYKTDLDFTFEKPPFVPPVLPSFRLGYGGGAMGYPSGLGKRYLFREFKTIEDLLGMGKKTKTRVKRGKRKRR